MELESRHSSKRFINYLWEKEVRCTELEQNLLRSLRKEFHRKCGQYFSPLCPYLPPYSFPVSSSQEGCLVKKESVSCLEKLKGNHPTHK